MEKSVVGGNQETVALKLAENISIVQFSKSVFFAEACGNFVKLNPYEYKLIMDFDGRNTLADIIAKRLEKGDTSVFEKLISLVEKLNACNLLDPECAVKLEKKKGKNFNGKILARKSVKATPLLSFLGRIMTSVPFLVFMFLLSMTTFLVPFRKGINIFTSITQGTFGVGVSYLLALVFILIFLFAILSLPAFCSAAGLSAGGFSPVLSLKFKAGFFYLSSSSAQIIGKGRTAALRHYAMLLLFPFAVSGVTALLWNFGIARPMMAVMNIIATGCGIIALSPIGGSPLSMMLNFFMPGDGKSFNYIRKHFIRDVFAFKKLSPETDRMIIVSSFGLIWIYVAYSYFWNVAKSTMSYLFSDFYGAYTANETGSMILIAMTILLIILPAVTALAGFLTIAFGNIGSVVATPLARMRDIAGEITAKTVPATGEIIEFLKQIPLFAELGDKELSELCGHIKLRRFMKASSIIRQGDKGDSFYTIVSGTADVVVSESNGTEKTVGTLSTGDSFGETALLEGVVRTASIIATTSVAVFEISRSAFEKFLASNAENREKLTSKIRLGKMLLASPVFSFMNQKQTAFLIKNLRQEKIKSGTVIFRQGDEGDRFYLVNEGEIHLERVDNSVKTLDIVLTAGNFFGEMALVKNIPRTATAEAVTDAVLFSLDKESFRSIMENSLFVGKELDSLINERAEQLGKEVLKSCSRN